MDETIKEFGLNIPVVITKKGEFFSAQICLRDIGFSSGYQRTELKAVEVVYGFFRRELESGLRAWGHNSPAPGQQAGEGAEHIPVSKEALDFLEKAKARFNENPKLLTFRDEANGLIALRWGLFGDGVKLYKLGGTYGVFEECVERTDEL